METICGKYLIEKLIQKGSFGEIYEVSHQDSSQKFAAKIEKFGLHDFLKQETRVLRILEGHKGIPKVYFSGRDNSNNYMVTELLGPSLLDVFNKGNIGLLQIANLTVQIIEVFKYIHSFGYVHRDIKPENFLLDLENSNLFVIDFGFAKKFMKNRNHVEIKEGKKFVGTARFASINALLGIRQSRRDDLEAIGYMIVYLSKRTLPWSHVKHASSSTQFQAIMELKRRNDERTICQDLPEEFEEFLIYCRRLGFDEEPDYDRFIQSFKTLEERLSVI